jgi:hypothetical protein
MQAQLSAFKGRPKSIACDPRASTEQAHMKRLENLQRVLYTIGKYNYFFVLLHELNRFCAWR